MRFEKNDIVVYKYAGEMLFRQIVEVMKKSYLWKHPEYGETTPDGDENLRDSINSSDPDLAYWELATVEEIKILNDKITSSHH